jgi:hypothetical protein
LHNQGQGCRLHFDIAFNHGYALSAGFGADIDHMGVANLIEMG